MKVLLIAASVALLTFTVACGSSKDAPQSQTQVPKQLPTATLDQILAPIALYPDALLAQILMSTSDPPKVTELDKWLKSNTQLKGTQLQDAAVRAGFDASFVALALFPQVVAKMAEQIAWTTLLGQAFAMDKPAVFGVIQKLRGQAKSVGTLKSTPQQTVETRKTSEGQDVIVIEPTNPQVVYVPQYNTEVVYTQAPTVVVTQPAATTVIVEDDDHDDAIAAGLIGFTAGIAIGATMNNSYYYGPYGFYGGAYMYNDAWNDYYDHREDAREDWMDHREDLVEERSDRLEDRGEQRSDRLQNTSEQRTQRQENRPESSAQRTERQQTRQDTGAAAQAQRAERSAASPAAGTQSAAATPRADRMGSSEARGYGSSGATRTPTSQTPTASRPDAFSGYSSGSSQRAASSRGQSSRSSSRSSSGRRR